MNHVRNVLLTIATPRDFQIALNACQDVDGAEEVVMSSKV
jgi:hypothetical protein